MVEQPFEEGGRGEATRQVGRNTHNLQLHRLPLELYCPDLEVDADCTQVAVRERVLGEAQEET